MGMPVKKRSSFHFVCDSRSTVKGAPDDEAEGEASLLASLCSRWLASHLRWTSDRSASLRLPPSPRSTPGGASSCPKDLSFDRVGSFENASLIESKKPNRTMLESVLLACEKAKQDYVGIRSACMRRGTINTGQFNAECQGCF